MSMTRGGYYVSYGYDANGNQVTSTDGNGTITNHYDELNRMYQTDYPNGTHKYYEYDKLGRKTRETDEENKITKFGYDATGKLTSVKQYLNGVELETVYGYDKPGNQIRQTDAKVNATGYRYDGMNRRIRKTLPSGIAEVYSYNAQTDLMDYMTDFNGDRTNYTYDPDTDKLTSESTKDKIISYGYDGWNRRDEMISNGESFSFGYNDRDRLTNKNWARGNIVYTRSVEGRLEDIMTNHGYNVGYTYNSTDGLLSSKVDNGTTQYFYDNLNNLDTVTYVNGVTTDYDYNEVNKLTKVTVKKDGVIVASWDYTLSPSGNKTSVTEQNGRAITWAYDDLYRLTNENILSGSITGNVGYGYDKVGNREQRTSSILAIPTQTFTYNEDDRTESYSWDNNGNLLNDGTFTYTWNGKNELVRVVSAGVDVSYGYDGDGLRISRTNNLTSVTTYFIWDDQNPTGYPQVIEEVENNVVTKKYGYGHYLETIDILNGAVYERFYVVRDGTTSIRMLMDGSGNVAATYDYDAFGNVISQTNPNPLTTNNAFGYDSEYKDKDTGLIYLRARWYKATDGRFVSRDKFEGEGNNPNTLNKYNGLYNNPINFTDPSGYMPEFLELMLYGTEIHTMIGRDFVLKTLGGVSNLSINTILHISSPVGLLRPDLVDTKVPQVYEIKPIKSAFLGIEQLYTYTLIMNELDPLKRFWVTGFGYKPPEYITIKCGKRVKIMGPVDGLILYKIEEDANDGNNSGFQVKPNTAWISAAFMTAILLAELGYAR